MISLLNSLLCTDFNKTCSKLKQHEKPKRSGQNDNKLRHSRGKEVLNSSAPSYLKLHITTAPSNFSIMASLVVTIVDLDPFHLC